MNENNINKWIENQKPDFVTGDVDLHDIEAIVQGGCASGAYMPAVRYYDAMETMNEHGDDVLDYIKDHYGELPQPRSDESWSGIAVHYLSLAVELWALSINERVEHLIDLIDDTDETCEDCVDAMADGCTICGDCSC